MNIDKTITFLNQTEGRDKFCKMIQYLSRFIKYHSDGKNEALHLAFKGLFENMSVARKLFRLFKSFNEYVKIKSFIKGDLPAFERNLNILARLGFLFYWVFDNLAVLIKVKFLQNIDLKTTARRASKCWLIGLFFSIIIAINGFVTTGAEEAKLLIQKAKAAQDPSFDQKKHNEAWKKVQAKKVTHLFNLIKSLGDTITASQSLGYPKRLFNFDFSDSWVGVGGFTSAALTCYQLYPAK